MQTIAVLGAGSWGTALALQLSRNGQSVRLWGHRHTHMVELAKTRSNEKYLPGVQFPDNLEICADLEQAIAEVDFILAAVPSAHFAELLTRLRGSIAQTPLMWAIKGFTHGSGRLLSQLFDEILGTAHPYAILAGPSFAKEVAAGLPTAVTIAARNESDATFFAHPFHGSNFLCYTSTDCISVQIGGAVKNVIAIATGIADGLHCGANTRAALITRGLHEITRLATALGGQAQTLAGLAGLGDLVLTATDDQSRNRRFGLALGRGDSAAQAKAAIGQVVEGEGAAHDTWQLAQRHQVHMPITEHVHRILSGELTPVDAYESLSYRVLKTELR